MTTERGAGQSGAPGSDFFPGGGVVVDVSGSYSSLQETAFCSHTCWAWGCLP